MLKRVDKVQRQLEESIEVLKLAADNGTEEVAEPYQYVSLLESVRTLLHDLYKSLLLGQLSEISDISSVEGYKNDLLDFFHSLQLLPQSGGVFIESMIRQLEGLQDRFHTLAVQIKAFFESHAKLAIIHS